MATDCPAALSTMLGLFKFNVSRKNGYKWVARYEAKGIAGLIDQPKAPHHQPARSSDDVEQNVLDLREKHPARGGRKLRKRFAAPAHEEVPAASTITEILRRHNKLDPGGRRQTKSDSAL